MNAGFVCHWSGGNERFMYLGHKTCFWYSYLPGCLGQLAGGYTVEGVNARGFYLLLYFIALRTLSLPSLDNDLLWFLPSMF